MEIIIKLVSAGMFFFGGLFYLASIETDFKFALVCLGTMFLGAYLIS